MFMTLTTPALVKQSDTHLTSEDGGDSAMQRLWGGLLALALCVYGCGAARTAGPRVPAAALAQHGKTWAPAGAAAPTPVASGGGVGSAGGGLPARKLLRLFRSNRGRRDLVSCGVVRQGCRLGSRRKPRLRGAQSVATSRAEGIRLLLNGGQGRF